MKKLRVSIGIPAYNEEANIKKLLLALLRQKRSNFVLKEIIVVSDQSTDRTVEEVKSVKDSKIRLIKNKIRLGQAGGQNKILKMFTGNVLVLLNADVLPANDVFISELVAPMNFDKSIGLISPKTIPLKGQTFFERVVNYSVDLKDAIFEKVNNGSNLYLCKGAARAFKRDLARLISWKESVSEDAFSYLSCIKEGYKFLYVSTAKLYFKSPDNFKDHLGQSGRFTQGPKVMARFLDEKLVRKEYSIPIKTALVTVGVYLVKNPVLFFCYMVTLLVIRINPRNADLAKSMWTPSVSSKVLKIS